MLLLLQIDLSNLGHKMTTASTSKKIFCVIQQGPYGNSRGKEALDFILAAAAIEQPINIAFINDGIWQLKTQQDVSVIGEKSFTDTYKALPLYGIQNIFVTKESLNERQLTFNDLIIPVTIITQTKLAELFNQQDIIITF